jgi:hypothetical protein
MRFQYNDSVTDWGIYGVRAPNIRAFYIFDNLIRYAKTQIQAGVMAASPNPFDSMSMIMHIQLAKKLNVALAEIERLKKGEYLPQSHRDTE